MASRFIGKYSNLLISLIDVDVWSLNMWSQIKIQNRGAEVGLLELNEY
jgi:hypothetical protein